MCLLCCCGYETGIWKSSNGLRNISSGAVTVKSKTVIAKVSVASVVLLMSAPRGVESANKESSDIHENSKTKDAKNTAKSARPKLLFGQVILSVKWI